MPERGLFISFEGGEGSGKTTQLNRLAERLTEKSGRKIITTREPGGTEEAEKIRDLIVQREGGDWNPMAEILLFFAARVMHIEQKIRPALAGGKIVITDRFTDSTRAYQGYGHGFDLQKIEDINQLSTGRFEPELTFIFDIEPKTGLERSGRRLKAEALNVEQTEDRFENLDLAFHERLREGFLEISRQNPARCIVIDATQDTDTITDQLEHEVMKRLEG